jgi:tetratricopeptide (TPR) repeat protein
MSSRSDGAAPLIVLALDGVDWALLQELAGKGLMPFLSSLVDAGTWAPLDFPLPACADSGWISAATGMLPDRHGVLHPLLPVVGSLFAHAPGAAALRTPAAWHAADDSGLHAAVIGWPATRGLRLRHGTVVAPGAEVAPSDAGQAWPLDAELVWPADVRGVVHASRLTPGDILEGDLGFLLGPLEHAERRVLWQAAAAALAQCATRHALGTAAIGERGADLLMLHLPFIAAMSAALAGVADRNAARTCLARCYQFLDLVCGRYQNLGGREASFAILSNGARDAGFVLLCGPGIARDRAIAPVSACDVWPTLAAAWGLPAGAQPDGRIIDEALAAGPAHRHAAGAAPEPPVAPLTPADIGAAPTGPALSGPDLAALERNGIPLPDFGPHIAFARGIECETRLALAAMTALRGRRTAALAQLRELALVFGNDLRVRMALAEQLLLAGAYDDCLAIARDFPLVQAGGVWADAVYGIVAYARADWTQAMARLGALAAAAAPSATTSLPINAAMWLGRVHLAQRDWVSAAASFTAAIAYDGRDGNAWSGLGMAEWQQERWHAAARAYGRAVSLGPRCAATLLRLGAAWERCGDMALGAQARARAMRIDPAAVARASAELDEG